VPTKIAGIADLGISAFVHILILQNPFKSLQSVIKQKTRNSACTKYSGSSISRHPVLAYLSANRGSIR